MADFKLANKVKDTSTSQTGSTITLSGTAPTGFQSFNAGVGDGNSTVYCAADTAGNWEASYGVYTNSAKTLGRLATPIASSNAGAQVVSFSGTVTVICGPEALMMTGALGNTLGGLSSNLGGGQRYWGPELVGFNAASANVSASAGFIWFVPILIPQWFSSMAMRVNIATLAAGTSTLFLGLYTHSGGGPLSRLGVSASIVSGNQGGGATGEQSGALTMDSTVPNAPGYYWAAVLCVTTAPSLKGAGSAAISQRLMGWASATGGGALGGYISASGQTSLPTTVTQSTLTVQTIGSPNLLAAPGF